ncbi:MAG: hydrolase, partial [Nocardioidaceae bacterium]|nr:hydrolase [Nocardioidaceae bacterium]
MSTSTLRVAALQAASGLDPAANRDLLHRLITAHSTDTDLVVAPEAFARDFGDPRSDLASDAETLEGPFVSALAEAARDQGTAVVAGMF